MQLRDGHINLPEMAILLLRRKAYVTTYYQLSILGGRYILYSVVFSLKYCLL